MTADTHHVQQHKVIHQTCAQLLAAGSMHPAETALMDGCAGC